MKVPAKTWEDIRKYYHSLPLDDEMRYWMLNLVEHISESSIGNHLHPWTSMFDLKITQTRNNPYKDDSPYLLVAPKSNGQIEFRYVDTYLRDRQWNRLIPAASANKRFDSFVKQLGWVQPQHDVSWQSEIST